MKPENHRLVASILASLVVLDVVLAVWGFAFPELWFSVFHGAAYVDPQGYLPRAAGNWTAFAILQALAFLRWEKAPHWLAVVAGVRLSDVFTDLSCMIFCENLSGAGLVLLSAAGLGNVFFGLYFLYIHRRVASPPLL
ncbi:MAG: hypothetical protein HZB23_12245 [Deltaproteobacteria bacterium]|nr:hypothetical protein [Deltaproteobacteria bacterium]